MPAVMTIRLAWQAAAAAGVERLAPQGNDLFAEAGGGGGGARRAPCKSMFKDGPLGPGALGPLEEAVHGCSRATKATASPPQQSLGAPRATGHERLVEVERDPNEPALEVQNENLESR
eukprot:1910490-Pyramimonas_sp.AAC.1